MAYVSEPSFEYIAPEAPASTVTKEQLAKVRIVLPEEALNEKYLLKDLPLGKHKRFKSAQEQTIQTWTLRGASEFPAVEIDGNNQKDAEWFHIYCKQFNKEGNVIRWSKEGFCYDVTRQALANIVDQPDVLLDWLMSRNAVHGGKAQINDLNFEFQDGSLSVWNTSKAKD